MFYLIDKPLHMTSFDVIRKLRKILNTKKIGHTGTLDPLATGCLLIATGNSTKLIPELENAYKRYQFTVQLNGKTASFDLWTEIIPVDTSHIQKKTPEEIKIFLESQTEQVPPKYSALHIDGKRAYELARQWLEFEIKQRAISIQDVEILEYNLPYSISIALTISSGGYIRSLAPTIGSFLGIDGGYISELRRTHIFFSGWNQLWETECTNIETLSLIPYSILFPSIPTISIGEEELEDLKNGKQISYRDEYPQITPDTKAFLKYSEEFISLCVFDGEKFTIIRNKV